MPPSPASIGKTIGARRSNPSNSSTPASLAILQPPAPGTQGPPNTTTTTPPRQQPGSPSTPTWVNLFSPSSCSAPMRLSAPRASATAMQSIAGHGSHWASPPRSCPIWKSLQGMVDAMRVWRFGSSVASSQAGPCGDSPGRERKAERPSARDLKTLADALWLH